MPASKTHDVSCKMWLEHKGKPLLGKGGAKILEQIEKQQSISKTAKKLGMSYRYVWSYLQKVERTLGSPVMETFRGGRSGGGGARLTSFGKNLLDEYRRIESYLDDVLGNVECWEVGRLRRTPRNRLKGKVLAVEKQAVCAKIKVEIVAPMIVTALISSEAAKELDIRVGDEVEAAVKATDVMIAK